MEGLDTAEDMKNKLKETGGLVGSEQKALDFVLKVYDEAAVSDSLDKIFGASLCLESLSQFFQNEGEQPKGLEKRAEWLQVRSEYVTDRLEKGKPLEPMKPQDWPVPILPAKPAATAAAPPTKPAAAPALTPKPAAAPPPAPPPAPTKPPAAAPSAALAAPAKVQALTPPTSADPGMSPHKLKAEARKKTDEARLQIYSAKLQVPGV